MNTPSEEKQSCSTSCCGIILKPIRLFLCIMNMIQPLWPLAARLWVANVFWKSGLVKISDWNNTLLLFEYEYQVPVLPIPFAAFSATAFELICPILLVLGFASRFSVLPLIAMTAIIEFTYQHNIEHTYWAFLLSAILVFGPGKISIDHWIQKKCQAKETDDETNETAS